MNTKHEGFQQGDVLLRKVSAIPADAKRRAAAGGRYVVAEGESTGHAHALVESEAVEMYGRNGVLYLKVTEPTSLVHEEHHAQTVAPGIYEVGKVVEVDPFTEEVRSVQD